MPTYQYRCLDCARDLEVVQKFSDPSLTECPTCHGTLRKVFNAVGVVFKGSGFYRTDSRPAESGSDTKAEAGAKSEQSGSDKGSSRSTDGSNGSGGSSTPSKADSGASSGGSGSGGSGSPSGSSDSGSSSGSSKSGRSGGTSKAAARS